MGDFEGGGADNLDLSGYTYGQLRDAVFQIVGDDLQAASNYLADLKRRLHERVGTLHVVIAKLRPDWKAKGGEAALEKLDQQLKWMQEFARVTAVNEAAVDDLIKARHKAVAAMRKLDAMPGGPTPPGAKGKPSPSPAPAPPQTGYVDPSTLDWRHPYAVRAATPLYNLLAITNASFPMPPRNPFGIDPGSSTGSAESPSRSPADGAGGGAGGPASPDSTADPTVRVQSAPGATTPSPVSGDSRPAGPNAGAEKAKPGVAPAPGVIAPGANTGVGLPGAGGRRDSGASTGRPGFGRSGAGTGAGASAGRGLGTGGARLGFAGEGVGSSGALPEQELGARVLGGGPRPGVGAPADVGGQGAISPGGGMSPGTGGGAGRGRRGKKTNYEQGEPETFVDGRFGNAGGGEIRPCSQPKKFDAGPGVLGSQKHRVPQEQQQREVWELPEGEPSPEGFPDELKSFTRKDGAQFKVRRTRGSGA